MRFGPLDRQIDIPESVIDAFSDGSLAIFAGAGVSYDPPSDYPDFVGLAREAGTAFGSADKEYEPTDQFFGRLDRAYPNRVHAWVRERLSRGGSRPNPNHVTLLRLFSSTVRVRIVTTNFDSHFSTAAKSLFTAKTVVEESYAPALPVGSHFAGLVYLHGTVTGPADRMVLTDYDFGRAYLTEGWACRFLVDLFRSYTVLFVGYSGADAVVQYLARGLSPENSKVFAFAANQGECDQWARLHVRPILYPTDIEKKDHSALWTGLERLADDINRNALDHERRIRALLYQAPPPANTDENDYLEAVFKSEKRIELFCRHAKDWNWVEWADRQGLLNDCFNYLGKGAIQFNRACWWLADRIAEAKGDAALRLLVEHKNSSSLTLLQCVLRTLGDRGDLNVPAVRSLIALLLDSPHAKQEEDVLVMYNLASTLTSETLPDFCLTVFRFLVTPRLSASVWPCLEPVDESGQSWVRYKVDCAERAERAESINLVWENVLKHNLACFAVPVVAVISDAFSLHRHLWNLSQEDVFDWDEHAMVSLEIDSSSPVHRTHDTIQALVDIHLKCTEWLRENKPELLSALVRVWMEAEAPMLRRFAVHALTMDPIVDPTAMLDMVSTKGLLADNSVIAEVNRLIQKFYPACDEDTRKRFIGEAMRQLEGAVSNESQGEEDAGRRLFVLFRVLSESSALPSSIAALRYEELKSTHPDWPCGLRDEFYCGVVKGSDLPSPMLPEALLAVPPAENIDFLLSFKDGDPFRREPMRRNLCQAVAQAIAKQPRWGIGYGEALMNKGEAVPADLWHALVQGMREAPLDDVSWHEFFSLLAHAGLPVSVVPQIGMFLSSRLENKEAPVPHARLPEAFELCKRLWKIDQSECDMIAGSDPANSRVSMTINHTGGIVVQCVLSMALRTRHHAPERWSGLPPEYRAFLESILSDSGGQGMCGRLMVARYLAHFLYVDQEWSREHILPLFDWRSSNEDAARAIWESHGIMGNVFGDVAQVVLPLYVSNIVRWENTHAEAITGLASKLVVILLWGGLSEEEQRLVLSQVAANGGTKTLAAFATQIDSALRDLDDDDKSRNWAAWMLGWLKLRISDAGRPVGDDELSALAEWAAYVPDFPAFVAIITKAEGRMTGACSHSLHAFQTKKQHVVTPDAAVRFLLWTLDHADFEPWSLRLFAELAEDLVALPEPPVELEGLLIKMGEKGAPSALTLQDELVTKRNR